MSQPSSPQRPPVQPSHRGSTFQNGSGNGPLHAYSNASSPQRGYSLRESSAIAMETTGYNLEDVADIGLAHVVYVDSSSPEERVNHVSTRTEGINNNNSNYEDNNNNNNNNNNNRNDDNSNKSNDNRDTNAESSQQLLVSAASEMTNGRMDLPWDAYGFVHEKLELAEYGDGEGEDEQVVVVEDNGDERTSILHAVQGSTIVGTNNVDVHIEGGRESGEERAIRLKEPLFNYTRFIQEPASDANSSKGSAAVEGDASKLSISCICSGRKFLAIGTHSGDVGIADPRTGELLRLLRTCNGSILSIKISEIEDCVGFSSQDGVVGVLSVSFKTVAKQELPTVVLTDVFKATDTRPVTCFAFEPLTQKSSSFAGISPPDMWTKANQRSLTEGLDEQHKQSFASSTSSTTSASKRFVSAGLSGKVNLHSKAWFGYKVNCINSGKEAQQYGACSPEPTDGSEKESDPPVLAVAWFCKTLVWLTEAGKLFVYNMHTSHFITQLDFNPITSITQFERNFNSQLNIYPCNIVPFGSNEFCVSWGGLMRAYKIGQPGSHSGSKNANKRNRLNNSRGMSRNNNNRLSTTFSVTQSDDGSSVFYDDNQSALEKTQLNISVPDITEHEIMPPTGHHVPGLAQAIDAQSTIMESPVMTPAQSTPHSTHDAANPPEGNIDEVILDTDSKLISTAGSLANNIGSEASSQVGDVNGNNGEVGSIIKVDQERAPGIASTGSSFFASFMGGRGGNTAGQSSVVASPNTSSANVTATTTTHTKSSSKNQVTTLVNYQGDFIICGLAPFGKGHLLLATLDAKKTTGAESVESPSPIPTRSLLTLRLVCAETGSVPIVEYIPFQGVANVNGTMESSFKYKPTDFILSSTVSTLYGDFTTRVLDGCSIYPTSNYEDVENGYLPTPIAEGFYFATPNEIILARCKDLEEHVNWLTGKHLYREAAAAVEDAIKMGGGESDTRHEQLRSNIIEMGQMYIQSLINDKKYEEAGISCYKILQNDKELWQNWIPTFLALQKISEICKLVPIEEPNVFDEFIYDSILSSLLDTDVKTLLEVAHLWPTAIYNTNKIADDVDMKLENKQYKDENEKNVLLECAYVFNVASDNWNKVLDLALMLHKGGYAELIEQRAIYDYAGKHLRELIEEDIYLVKHNAVFRELVEGSSQLTLAANQPEYQRQDILNRRMRIANLIQSVGLGTNDVIYNNIVKQLNNSLTLGPIDISLKEEEIDRLINRIIANGSIKGLSTSFLVDYQMIITIEYVKERIFKGNHDGADRCYYIYLDATFRLDPTRVSFTEFFNLLEFYLNLDPVRVLPLVKSKSCKSQMYDKILERIGKLDSVADATVYLLIQKKRYEEALMLIVDKLGDVAQAIKFARDMDNEQIWDALLNYSTNKPVFIVEMLNQLASCISPVKLIEKIPKNLHIPGLKNGLKKFLQDYMIQVHLKEAGKGLVEDFGVALMERRRVLLLQGTIPNVENNTRVVPKKGTSYTCYTDCGHLIEEQSENLNQDHVKNEKTIEDPIEEMKLDQTFSIYKGKGKPKNTDYDKFGNIIRDTEDLILARYGFNILKHEKSKYTLYRNHGRPRSTDYDKDHDLIRTEKDYISALLTGNVSSKTKSNWEILADENGVPRDTFGNEIKGEMEYSLAKMGVDVHKFRRAQGDRERRYTIYRGKGAPRKTDYDDYFNVIRTRPQLLIAMRSGNIKESHFKYEIYSGTGKPKVNNYSSTGKLILTQEDLVRAQTVIFRRDLIDAAPCPTCERIQRETSYKDYKAPKEEDGLIFDRYIEASIDMSISQKIKDRKKGLLI